MGTRQGSKHRLVYDHIQRKIATGEFSVGHRIPTEPELASTFSVSRVTVSRALRDLEQQGYLRRQRGSGSFVMRPCTAEGSLLGLIMSDRGIFAEITDEMARLAQVNGFGLLLGKWGEGSQDELATQVHAICHRQVEHKVAGVIYTPLLLQTDPMQINRRVTDFFEKSGVPVVLLDRDIYDYPDRSHYDLVGMDNRHAGFTLASHLLSLGYRRIDFVTNKSMAATITARIAGYQEALFESGISVHDQRVHRGDVTDAAFVRRIFATSLPEAVICANDCIAASLMRHLDAMHVRVPDDIAIVGVDDDELATLLSVSLTTFRQPRSEIGSAVVELLLERMRGNGDLQPREVCFKGELVVRESCGASSRELAEAR